MFSSYYIYTISVALLQGCSCASPLASAKHCFRGCMCSSSRAHHPSPFPPESLRSCSRVHMTRQVNLGPGQRQEGRGRGGSPLLHAAFGGRVTHAEPPLTLALKLAGSKEKGKSLALARIRLRATPRQFNKGSLPWYKVSMGLGDYHMYH